MSSPRSSTPSKVPMKLDAAEGNHFSSRLSIYNGDDKWYIVVDNHCRWYLIIINNNGTQWQSMEIMVINNGRLLYIVVDYI